MADLLGWSGTIIYLINHAYISYNQNWQKTLYFLGNSFAAVCLIISSLATHSWQAVIINCFWLIISLLLLSNIQLKSLKINIHIFYQILVGIWLVIAVNFFLRLTSSLSLIGWSSVFVFSVAYLLFSVEKMGQRSYLLWNAYAAVTLLPQLWLDQNWPVFSLEIAWVSISIYGVLRRFKPAHLID